MESQLDHEFLTAVPDGLGKACSTAPFHACQTAFTALPMFPFFGRLFPFLLQFAEAMMSNHCQGMIDAAAI
jgi:hypothetical protein